MLSKSNKNKEQGTKSKEQRAKPPVTVLCGTAIGLKNPACSLHAPFSDVQDANEMRTVEDGRCRVRGGRFRRGDSSGDARQYR